MRMRMRAKPKSTDERIADYKKVYFSVHGKIPNAVKAGAWIHITTEDGTKTIRSKDIPKMILELKKKDLEIKPHIDDFFMIDGSWYRIKNDIIKLFFERLYEKCGHSILKMEETLMDYAMNETLSYGFKADEFKDKCDGCDYLSDSMGEAEYLSNEVTELEKENKKLQKELDSLTSLAVKREGHWKKEVDRLKEESVLFSMDDFEFKEFDPDEEEDIGDILKRKLNRTRRYIPDDDVPF